MTTQQQQNPLPRDPPEPPGSRLEELVDDLDSGSGPQSTEPRTAPGTEPPDA